MLNIRNGNHTLAAAISKKNLVNYHTIRHLQTNLHTIYNSLIVNVLRIFQSIKHRFAFAGMTHWKEMTHWAEMTKYKKNVTNFKIKINNKLKQHEKFTTF